MACVLTVLSVPPIAETAASLLGPSYSPVRAGCLSKW